MIGRRMVGGEALTGALLDQEVVLLKRVQASPSPQTEGALARMRELADHATIAVTNDEAGDVRALAMLTVRDGEFRPGPRVAAGISALGITAPIPAPDAFISECRRLAMLDALDEARLAGAL